MALVFDNGLCSDAEWHLSAVSELQRVVLEFDKQHTLPREAFDVYFDAAAHFQTSFERYVLEDLRAQWEKSAGVPLCVVDVSFSPAHSCSRGQG